MVFGFRRVHRADALEGGPRIEPLDTFLVHEADAFDEDFDHLLEQGFPFPGHTPYLAHLCGLDPDDAVMLFAGGRLRVVLATVHVPLKEVPRVLDAASIVRAARAGITAPSSDLDV